MLSLELNEGIDELDMHESPFGSETIAYSKSEFERIYADMTPNEQAVGICAVASQVQLSVIYKHGALSKVLYKGDGILGHPVPKAVALHLLPEKLPAIDMLYLHGFVTLVKDPDSAVCFNTELINILRNPQMFKEQKKRLRFIATSCYNPEAEHQTIVESLDALEDVFETNIQLSTIRILSDVIANLCSIDVQDELHFDSYWVREVSYNGLVAPWQSSLDVTTLKIPFSVAKEITGKTK